MKKFSVLSILAVALMLSWIAAAQTASMEGAEYVGNAKCKICHNKPEEGNIWTTWKSMNHAKAFELLKSGEAVEAAKKKGIEKPPAEAPECLKCHVTAYDPKTGAGPAGLVKEDGVQCESCHGPGSLHMADGKKFKATKDASIDMGAHMTHPKVEMCVTCHNEESATWNPERYTLPDGKKTGFDFAQAWEKVKHGLPDKDAKAK